MRNVGEPCEVHDEEPMIGRQALVERQKSADEETKSSNQLEIDKV
jgi:hypothetical protein